MNLQRNFNYLKKSRSLSFRDISKATGINTNTLNILAKGDENNARIETIDKLAKYFDISIDELVNGKLEID